MIRQLLSIIRDICLFFLLIVLVQIAVKDTKKYILAHKESMVHQLDRTFMDQLYTTQRQLHILENNVYINSDFFLTITELKHKLSAIETSYKKNSPGLALLGPIGTAAIVTKEEQLSKKLLLIINEIGNILHTLVPNNDIFKPALSINNGLTSNKEALKKLYH